MGTRSRLDFQALELKHDVKGVKQGDNGLSLIALRNLRKQLSIDVL